jgi:hypothetical protein
MHLFCFGEKKIVQCRVQIIVSLDVALLFCLKEMWF